MSRLGMMRTPDNSDRPKHKPKRVIWKGMAQASTGLMGVRPDHTPPDGIAMPTK